MNLAAYGPSFVVLTGFICQIMVFWDARQFSLIGD